MHESSSIITPCWGLDGIGHTARRIIKNYIQRNPDKGVDELNGIFGKRTVFPENKVPSKEYHFPKHPVDTNQGRLYITNLWATKNRKTKEEDERWLAFQKKTKTYGYTINECRFVNIKEGDTRDWDACRYFGFLSASGESKKGRLHENPLKKLSIGTIVFAFLVRDSSGKKGFVGMGEVTALACPIQDFNVEGIGLLDSKDESGEIYKEKFPKALELANDSNKCEWCLKVHWRKTFSREDAAEGEGNRNIVWSVIPRKTGRSIKAKFEKN